MSGFDRRRFLKLTGGTGAIALSGLAGCTGGPSGETEETTTTEDDSDGTTQQSDEPDANVGMVYATGGLGDGSFNDQAQTGLLDAADEYDIEYEEAQPENVSDFANFQEQFAQSTDPAYDLVSAIGSLQADALAETAPDYPDQNFMIVDNVVDEPNVASYTYKEHEGSYLAGRLVGSLTTREFSAGAATTKPSKKKVGFVGGIELDLIKKFEAGFRAGVLEADPDIEIQSVYTGSFNDTSAGKEAALNMYNDGADFVYHASGNTGTGVFQAAQEQGRFAIGVDKDQSITKSKYADVILASMVKRVDKAVYQAVQAVAEDSLEGGSITTYGLAEDGVPLVYGDQIGDEVPQDVVDTVETAREKIISGDITVPTTPEDV